LSERHRIRNVCLFMVRVLDGACEEGSRSEPQFGLWTELHHRRDTMCTRTLDKPIV
jgi:hypothetical protein